MIGNLDVADDIFLARGHVRENRCQQIIGTHALDLRWDFLATLKAQQSQRASGIPAPTGAENGRGQCRLLQYRLNGFRLKELENIGKGKTVLLGQSNVQSIVGGCGLQFKVEAPAEALTERQSPGFVDTATKWSVDDQLHSAAFIEKALRDNCFLSGHGTQDRTALQDVLDDLFGSGIIQAAFFFQPRYRLGYDRLRGREANRRDTREPIAYLLPQVGKMSGEFRCARGRLAQPEGDSWGRSLRIFDDYAT